MAASARLGHLDPDEVETRVTLVFSQLLGMVLTRRIIKLEPLAGLPAEQLVTLVTPTVARYLLDDLPLGAGDTLPSTPRSESSR